MTDAFTPETVERQYATELREIAGMVAQTPDGPLRWKQYRLVAIADFLDALSAPSPISGEAMRGAIERFLADYDDGDRADAGNNALMEAHVADFRAAIAPKPDEVTIPASMKHWHGGDSAPEDWDEKSVLLRDGTGCVGIGVFRWDHQGFGDDIIAYTPKPRVTAGEKDALISAAFGAIYDPGADPFEHPERWEFATSVVDAILPHLATPDARLREENEALKRALDDIRGRASGRDALPLPSGTKETHRNVATSLAGLLGSIERSARAALGGETKA